MTQIGATEKCYCPECKRKTNHVILASEKNSWSNEEDCFYLEHTYRIVRCCGCDHISFSLEKDGTEYEVYDQGGYITRMPEYVTYPEQEGAIEPIDDNWSIPAQISIPYHEAIKCINADCYLLAALGFRTTVEAICLDKKVNGGDLNTKIDNLQTAGAITRTNCERLHEARFMGNESAHEMKTPDKQQLLLVMEVINNILENLYVIDKKCKEIFDFRFKDFNHFMNIISASIANCKPGDVSTIYGFLPEDRKYKREDILTFQSQLQDLIDKGSFTKLKKTNDHPYKGINRYEVL